MSLFNRLLKHMTIHLAVVEQWSLLAAGPAISCALAVPRLQQWDISCGLCDSDQCLRFTSTRGFPASALLPITNVVREAR